MKEVQIPIVPHIVGKDSLLLGKRFPHFVGTNSHNMREYFPTICGTIGTCTSLVMVDYLFLYSCYRLTGKNTMRNENQKYGSSSNLVANSLSLYSQVNNYLFLLTFIRKYRHWLNERRKTYHQIWRRTPKTEKCLLMRKKHIYQYQSTDWIKKEIRREWGQTSALTLLSHLLSQRKAP